MSYEKVLFKSKTLSDIFSEIYDNSRKKDTQISDLIGQLKPLIESIEDATLLVPLIKEYLDVSVKNDEHLIKLASIVQRLENSSKGGDEDLLDTEEIQALLDEMENNEVVTKEVESKKESIEE